MSSSGAILWSKTIGGPGSDAAGTVITTNDGGLAIAGATPNFGADSTDLLLVKTDANGDTLWTRTYGEPGWDYFGDEVALQQTSDNGYVMVGATSGFGAPYGKHFVYVVKTDSTGYAAKGGTVNIAEKNKSDLLHVYPNPSNDIFNVQTNAIGSLRVFNLLGEQLFIKENFNGGAVDLSKQAKGVYVIVFQSGEQSSSIKLLLH